MSRSAGMLTRAKHFADRAKEMAETEEEAERAEAVLASFETDDD